MSTKVPFRHQISEFDCVPTTFLNAISYLFGREDVPPELIQRTYMYCLDSMSSRGGRGHGTSGPAVELLSNWLSELKHPRFAVEFQPLKADQVHLREGSPLTRCLNQKGVASVSITHKGGWTHEILALRADKSWLYFFDPYPKTTRGSKPGCYEFLPESGGQSPNLRISRAWLDVDSDKKPFRLGLVSERECLLIFRSKKRAARRRART